MIEVDNMTNDEIRFIDKLFKDLYSELKDESDVDKLTVIRKYLESQNELHKKMGSKKSRLDILKSFYYDKYVINESNITDKYFEHQQNIALELGHGHVSIDDDLKHELSLRIINDQKKSLDRWLDYLITNDAYPFWVKYWAFQGMMQIGNYDIENGTYSRRTKKTVSPFIDVNPEAIAIAMDLILKRLHSETIDDKGNKYANQM